MSRHAVLVANVLAGQRLLLLGGHHARVLLLLGMVSVVAQLAGTECAPIAGSARLIVFPISVYVGAVAELFEIAAEGQLIVPILLLVVHACDQMIAHDY